MTKRIATSTAATMGPLRKVVGVETVAPSAPYVSTMYWEILDCGHYGKPIGSPELTTKSRRCWNCQFAPNTNLVGTR